METFICFLGQCSLQLSDPHFGLSVALVTPYRLLSVAAYSRNWRRYLAGISGLIRCWWAISACVLVPLMISSTNLVLDFRRTVPSLSHCELFV